MNDFKRVEIKFNKSSKPYDEEAEERSARAQKAGEAATRRVYAAFVSAWLLMLVIGSPDWNYWRSLAATTAAMVLMRGVIGARPDDD